MQRSGGCSTITEERKSTEVDNIPVELVQAGEKDVITALMTICNKIWPMDPVLSHHTSQERQPVAVPELPNDQPHSHPSKVMLILNRLKPQAEKIITEEQAGFRARRSTTEQIFNLRILCDKKKKGKKSAGGE